MTMTVQGRARVRRVGNGLCVPLPTRDLREEGIREGDEVDYIVMKPTKPDPKAFGSLKRYFEGVDLQQLMDEDRAPIED